jgi:hypothetical protein
MRDEIVYSVILTDDKNPAINHIGKSETDASDGKNYIIFYSKSPDKTKLVNKRLSTSIEIKSKNFGELIDTLKGELSDDEFTSISKIYVESF